MSAQRVRRRRKTGRQTLHYLLLMIVAGGILAILSYTVFFPIEEIQVEGLTRYAAETIVKSSGIHQGDNLLRIREGTVEKTLQEAYPYIEKVDLQRVIPGTLVLEITEAVPLGACYTPAGYVVLGETGRVLDMHAEHPPAEVMVVTGMYFYAPQLGEVLGTGYEDQEQEQAEREWESFTMLSYLAKAVAEIDFTNITMADLSDRLNMMLLYEDRVIVELGSEANLSYKLNFVKYLLENELEKDYHGVLDASLAADSKKVWSDPGNIVEELAVRGMTLPTREETTASGETSSPGEAGGADSSSDASAGASSLEDALSGETSSSSGQSAPGEVFSNPDLAVIPGSATSASSALSKSGDSAQDGDAKPSSSDASSAVAYSPEDLAVVPGTGSGSVSAESSASGQ